MGTSSVHRPVLKLFKSGLSEAGGGGAGELNELPKFVDLVVKKAVMVLVGFILHLRFVDLSIKINSSKVTKDI